MKQHQAQSAPMALSDLETLERFAEANHHLMTKAALLWQVRHRNTNGLASACVRVGKRLLISRSRYEAWLATRAGAA